MKKREFPTFSNSIIFVVHVNAWKDKKDMLIWVEQILNPYIAMALCGVAPIKFFDSYMCHMMRLVISAVEDLSMEVEHIPWLC